MATYAEELLKKNITAPTGYEVRSDLNERDLAMARASTASGKLASRETFESDAGYDAYLQRAGLQKIQTPQQTYQPAPQAPMQVTWPGQNQQIQQPQQEVSQKPGYLRDDGSFDQSYIPKSEQEIAQANVDSYTRNILTANYYRSKGINFDPSAFPTSFEEEAKLFLERQDSEMSLLDRQIEAAKGKAVNSMKENTAAVNSQFAVNREGVTSVSNQTASQKIQGRMKTDTELKLNQLDAEKRRLDELRKEQQRNFVAGREEQIRAQEMAVAEAQAALLENQAKQREETMGMLKMLKEDNGLANLSPEDIQYLEEFLPGAPPGVISVLSNAATRNVMNAQQKERFSQQVTALNTFKGLVNEGVQITPQMMLNFAEQTGLSMDTMVPFNMAAQQIMNDKQLGQAEKMMKLEQLGGQLDREQRGILNAELEKVDYITRMYQEGRSPEEIAEVKKILGIKDENDPMYQAELALKQAQADIERKKANGEPITLQDQLAELEAREAINEIIGGGSSGQAYIPSASLENIKTTFQNGKLIISNGNKPMQCGAFVNRFWGIGAGGSGGFSDTYASKQQVVNTRGVKKEQLNTQNFTQLIKPGMAFVTNQSVYGHVGIVTQVFPDGTFTTMEANIGDRNPSLGPNDYPQERRRSIKDGDLYGFAAPPEGKANITGQKQPSLSDAYKLGYTTEQQIKDYKAMIRRGETPPDLTKSKVDKDTFSNENTLRDEFTKNTQNYVKIRDAYNTIQSAATNPTAAGDLSLIFAYMKMLDPSSTVREGEFANAQNAAGIPVQIQNIWNKAINGERLNEDQRKDFVNQSKKIYDVQKTQYDNQVAQTKKLAESYGLDSSRVLYDFSGSFDYDSFIENIPTQIQNVEIKNYASQFK